MTLTGQLVDAGTVSADLNGFSAMALRWRHEPDAAVAVLVVVPIHESRDPGAGLLDTLEWPLRTRPLWRISTERCCSWSPRRDSMSTTGGSHGRSVAGLRSISPSRSRSQLRQQGRLALCLQSKADGSAALTLLNLWIAKALGLGASLQEPPRQEPFGAEAWLLDPEGNRLLLLVLP